MATQTSFLGLTKQDGTEKNHRPVINANYDIEDAFASGISEALAIVVNGNTAPQAIAAGQYLFIKNHSTLATGGYHAKSAISSGATISSSNVEADADGIANSLYANKANYLFIDATSYTHNSKSGWDFVYGKIPDGYNGILKINFDGGYNNVCTVYRQSSNWGSIIGHENSNHIPFFYNVQAGTSTLDELALNSEIPTIAQGTKIAYGSNTIASNSIMKSISFGVTFTSTPKIIITPKYDTTTTETMCYGDVTTTGCNIYRSSSKNATQEFSWIAIGI
jgi:hypothetical protein